uniref:AT-rich interaction domain 6 n=1 Tax=Semicossyphus pulcher TaxID=241346 RepID=UPI0037E855CB
MPILAMETQAHMEMAHGEIQEERSKDPAEEIPEREFLKNLYVFMKNRDTPIERIPNLGFKQIDLYLMFKTVKDLGGYHQVTAQQMWKQVYNMLGGNPRSTSAATCTRRHYEKLLLPYECHLKGITINMSQHQPKPFPFTNYAKEDSDGQRPSKRRLSSIGLQQSPHYLESDPRGRVFSLPLSYSPYYRPSPAVQTHHVPISSKVLTQHTPPAPQPWFPFQPCCPNPSESVKEPLEHLRSLAEQYKTSSGLTEPLNLSVKETRQETSRNPVSSFAPPALSKNPKFLNKPSTLYTPHSPRVRNEECETQDGEAVLGDEPYSCPSKDREAYVVDVKAITTSGSPTYSPTLRADGGATALAEKPSSPKTDFIIQQTEEGEKKEGPEVRGFNLSHLLPSLARENGGKMEIEIPLSLFHNWLRLCGSTATMHGLSQLTNLPSVEEQSSRSDRDVLPTNLTLNSQHQSSGAEDLRLRKRNLPSPSAPTMQARHPNNTSQHPLTSYKLLSSGGILKSAPSRDVYSFDQQDLTKSNTSKSPGYWDAIDQKNQAFPIRMKNDFHNPLTVQQDFAAPKSYNENSILGRKEKSEMSPSAVLMLGSSSAPLLHLTTEEVMKLKKIISSS